MSTPKYVAVIVQSIHQIKVILFLLGILYMDIAFSLRDKKA